LILFLHSEGREKVENCIIEVKVIQDTTKVSDPIFRMRMKFREKQTLESANSKTFDDALLSLQTKLPDKLYFKNCWGCAFSEYSPMGQRKYGSLACFRDWPDIKKVRSTVEVLRSWPLQTEVVQEFHDCKFFNRRTKPRFVVLRFMFCTKARNLTFFPMQN
jgi:hypothetical protein